MSRRGWLIFLAVQTAGEVCVWTARHFLSALGPALWVIGSVLLLPGDLVSAFLVERLLWKSGLTAGQLTTLQVPVGLAINAVVWLLSAVLYSFLRGRQHSLPSAHNTTNSNLPHRPL